jgi:hypothetical protein
MNWQMTGFRVLGITGLLVGCAGSMGVYDKSGAAEADVRRDRAACLQAAASDSEAFRFSGPTIDRDVFARCMQAKGYTLRK